MTGHTRQELLLAGVAGVARVAGVAGMAGTAGMAGAGAALVAPASALAQSRPPQRDRMPLPERLGRLMELEMLLLFCYEHVLASGILGPRAQRTLAPFPAQERAHIAALKREMTVYGGRVPAPPADVKAANRDLAHRKIGGRLGQLKGDLDAMRLLLTTEQVTIGAYFVALRTVAPRGLIELMCQIMANDAQHDAMLGLLLPPGKPASAVPYGLVQGLQ